jgi:predicted nucleic acid-binding protein
MILPDVNVLVYAHREDAVDHPRYRHGWRKLSKAGSPMASMTMC